MSNCEECGWPEPCDCEPERSAGSLERVVRPKFGTIVIELTPESKALMERIDDPQDLHDALLSVRVERIQSALCDEITARIEADTINAIFGPNDKLTDAAVGDAGKHK